jgi:hypothetical protein
MRSKKEIEKELMDIKAKLQSISDGKVNYKQSVQVKEDNGSTSSNLFTIVKYMFDENRKNTLLLKNILESIARLETELRDAYYEEVAEPEEKQTNVKGIKEIPVSGLDAQIIQAVQIMGMACADDIKKRMNYKGRNAASTRLNKLYKIGLLQRYQLGRKVYYKYDAGKATDTLIVSPPQ